MSVLGHSWGNGPSARSRNRPHGNLSALRIAVFLLFLVLVAQLFRMQILDGSDYAQRSRENHITQKAILPTRGLITDRNGEALVQNVGVFTANVTPEFLPEDEDQRYRIYLAVEQLIGVPALEIQSRVKAAEDNGTPFIDIPIKKYLSKEEALKLDEASADLPGVTLSVRPGREYPAGSEFGPILGYIGDQTAEEYVENKKAGYFLNEQVGKSGVEASYEADLHGQAGAQAAEQDAQGHLLKSLDTVDPTPGNSVQLSIDAGLQRYVAELLRDNMAGDATHPAAKTAAAVVMSPKTGEIYALVSVPDYDNNILAQSDVREQEYLDLLRNPLHPLTNQALSPSAPGSVFKLVTASAALQTHHITPSTGFDVTSRVLEVKGENGQLYDLVDWAVHGYVDLYAAIARSSNQYFFMSSCGILGQSQGLARDSETSAVVLGYYARSYGFGQHTGIDIGGEADTGVVPDPAWKRRVHANDGADPNWYYADTCFMGIGQGDVLATPLQVARMTSAVANGGTLLTPHVAKDVVDPAGNVIRTIAPESTVVPVDPAFLADIRHGMHDSVQATYGAGIRAQRQGIDIAGKTGTAEFFLPSGEKSEHAWFTGFAPFNDPEVVVTVYFDIGIGGQKAAPVAGQIFDYFMNNVKP